MSRKCKTCGKPTHDFEKEEAFGCVPPRKILKFGTHEIDEKYRSALYRKFPMYNSEEIVGSYLGHNPYFPGYHTWLYEKERKNRQV